MLKIAHIREEREQEVKILTLEERIAVINSPEFVAKLRRDIIREHNAKIAKQNQR